MELLEEIKPEKTSIYPQIYWEVRGEYGLASILLILIERDLNIQSKLYPQNGNNNRQKKAQCKKLAQTLFINIPEINIHLGNPDGLDHYAISIMTRIRLWTASFLKVILTMPHSSNWPDQHKIKLLCPSFARLAPLLWGYLKTCRKFMNPDVSIAVACAHLEFCSAITVYDPQLAAAQISAQNAVLRQLQDPYRRLHDIPITFRFSRYRLPKTHMIYNGPPQELIASIVRKILPVTDPCASQSGEHEPKTSTQNFVSDIAVLSAQQTPRHGRIQARSGAFQPPQHKQAAQKITTGKLGEKPKRRDKIQLQEIEILFNEQEPEANPVRQLELELMELKDKTTELERIVIELVKRKRKGRLSHQGEEDAADAMHLAKKQRGNEPFGETSPQTPKNVRHSSNGPKLGEVSWYLNSETDDTHDNLNTTTDAIPPRINNNFVASAGFRQEEKKERVCPWHSPPHMIKPSASPPPQRISHVSSRELLAIRLEEAAYLEQQGVDSAPPRQNDEHELSRT